MEFFKVEKSCGQTSARAGVLQVEHGKVQTPVLMTVGTKANVKSVDTQILQSLGVQVVLANTFHLHIFPGESLVASFGGLHKFMSWPGPMFTDSGGFQVFSMGHGNVADEIKGKGMRHGKRTLLKIDESGAVFKSYRDGAEKILTPEISMQIQHKLGADMVAAFDECTPFHAGKIYTEKSMHRTHRWLKRCQSEMARIGSKQKLFGIVQGGVFEDLREISCNFVANAGTSGICIGGSLGRNKQQMASVVEFCMKRLPKEKPVHLLGVGDFPDLVLAVESGVDSFDCVSPTRNARHGLLFSREFPSWKMNLTASIFKADPRPICKSCQCPVCQKYSRGYLHFLLRANEMLGMQLCTMHNIFFMHDFMRKMREAILHDNFPSFKNEVLRNF